MIDFIEYYVNGLQPELISELLVEFYDLDLYTFFPQIYINKSIQCSGLNFVRY